MIIGTGIGVPFNSKTRRIIARDSFNRPDNPTSLGSAETGQPWITTPNLWGIIGNQAYTSDTTASDYAVVDVFKPDATVSSKIKFNSNEGVIFRYSDINNHLGCRISPTNIILFKAVVGIVTTLGTYPLTPVVGSSYELKVTCKGNSIKAFVDNVNILNISETFNQTATKFGLRSTNSSIGRFDDFIVEG